MNIFRLLGGDDERKSAAEDETGVADGLVEEESDAVDDMLTVMETLEGDDDFTHSASTTATTTTMTTTSGLDAECSAAACSTLSDSDVGRALDAALQNGFDGLLSTIGDDRMTCASSAETASSDGADDLLLAASVLPPSSTETDQHYLFYSAETDEMIDTFLRSTDAAVDGDDAAAETAVLGELQAVRLSDDDWQQAEPLNDVQMGGGMLVEFDSSLLTIIELENDQMPPIDTEACLTVAPGGGLGHVVSDDEVAAWNVFHGLEVSQFQVVTSDRPDGAPADDGSPESERDDVWRDALDEGADEAEPEVAAPSAGREDSVGPADVPDAPVQTDDKPSNCAGDSDDEYVFIVDCVDGSEADELDYEIVDEVDPATGSSSGSAATTPGAVERSPTTSGGDDVSDDDEATNSS